MEAYLKHLDRVRRAKLILMHTMRRPKARAGMQKQRAPLSISPRLEEYQRLRAWRRV